MPEALIKTLERGWGGEGKRSQIVMLSGCGPLTNFYIKVLRADGFRKVESVTCRAIQLERLLISYCSTRATPL